MFKVSQLSISLILIIFGTYHQKLLHFTHVIFLRISVQRSHNTALDKIYWRPCVSFYLITSFSSSLEDWEGKLLDVYDAVQCIKLDQSFIESFINWVMRNIHTEWDNAFNLYIVGGNIRFFQFFIEKSRQTDEIFYNKILGIIHKLW